LSLAFKGQLDFLPWGFARFLDEAVQQDHLAAFDVKYHAGNSVAEL
jgi:hypothetical protein